MTTLATLATLITEYSEIAIRIATTILSNVNAF